MADRPETADDVKALVQAEGIRFVRLWFTDILGQLKSFAIAADQLDDAFEGGMGFDGSSITGFNAIEESDMIAVPDLSDRLLSERMKELEGRGIVVRHVSSETPVKVCYELTEKGRQLAPALDELKTWADRWLV